MVKKSDDDDEGSSGPDDPQEDEILGDLLWNDICLSERHESEWQARRKQAAKIVQKRVKPAADGDPYSNIESDLLTSEDDEDMYS